MSEDDVAKSLIAGLAGEGEHVDDGSFTLDPAAAYQKLRQHQLADPHGYVLLLIEAAWLTAADEHEHQEVRIEIGSTTTVEFSALALAPGSLCELFAAALRNTDKLEGEALRRARVLQLLGLAANSALALGPKQIIIEASDIEGNGQRVRVDPSGAITLEPSKPLASCRARFVFCGSMFAGKRGRAERELLEQRCRYTQLAIRINHHLISRHRDLVLDDGIDSISGKRKTAAVELDGRTIGFVGGSRHASTQGCTWIVNRGIAIAEPAPKFSRLQTVVEVDLPTDLSRTQLVQGPELEQVRQVIRDTQMQVAEPVRSKPATPSKPKSQARPQPRPKLQPRPKPVLSEPPSFAELVLFVVLTLVSAMVTCILHR